MNEHAKEIWQAWLDDRIVQRWLPSRYAWVDEDPCESSVKPHEAPEKWRIKQPDKKTKKIRYRVALIDCGHGEAELHIVYPYHGIHVDFVRWVSPEQEVELYEGEWEEEE